MKKQSTFSFITALIKLQFQWQLQSTKAWFPQNSKLCLLTSTNRYSKFLLAFSMLAILSACSPRYSNSIYAPQVIDNIKIAILPYQVTTTGRITELLDEYDIAEIEAAESVAFQTSMYHQLINRLERNRYSNDVVVQHYSETNNILAKAELSSEMINGMSSNELTVLLGVDAVIRSEVHKQTFLTNLESYGIELARSILIIFGEWSPWYFPGSETGEVRISTSIISGDSGATLWAASKKSTTNWDRDTYATIERINRRITKGIPFY